MQKRFLAAVLGVTLSGVGCSNESNRENQTYRWIGFLVDGSTATPLALTGDDKSSNQVFAVVEGKVRRAKPCDGSDEKITPLPGCFMLDDLPVSSIYSTNQQVNQIPVFATYEGYERFQGQLTGMRSVDTENVTEILDMQLYANIRVFPKNYQVAYRVWTAYNNRPVPNVRVVCQIRNANGNEYATNGNFIAPDDSLGGVVDVRSDDSGYATLSTPLVNGATYNCYANRAEPFEGHIVQGSVEFVAGVSAAEQTIALNSDPDPVLFATSASNQDPGVTLGADGKLSITFNRPIEILPGTTDCQFATLSAPDTNGDTNAAGPLPTTISGNANSEQVNATVSGGGLTLELGFKPGTPGVNQFDLGSTVTFSGIFIRPLGAEPAYVFRIGSATGAATPACALGQAYAFPNAVVNIHTGAVSPTIRLF
ncbi:hypothetical protein [Archangium sp.]|uniref:hypothetical protein n=1 Tax=Archangium sp. TaxID=1872627 RepID=UPI00286A08B8|nr:hypothetical protein [Archangium sp.]